MKWFFKCQTLATDGSLCKTGDSFDDQNMPDTFAVYFPGWKEHGTIFSKDEFSVKPKEEKKQEEKLEEKQDDLTLDPPQDSEEKQEDLNAEDKKNETDNGAPPDYHKIKQDAKNNRRK